MMSFLYYKRIFTMWGSLLSVLVIFAHFLVSKKAFLALVTFGLLGTLSSSVKKRFLKKNNDSLLEIKHGRSAF